MEVTEKEKSLLEFVRAVGIDVGPRSEVREYKDKTGKIISYPRILEIKYTLTMKDD